MEGLTWKLLGCRGFFGIHGLDGFGLSTMESMAEHESHQIPWKPEPGQMDGKRFKYISAISLLTVWGALKPWLERKGACWLVQQTP